MENRIVELLEDEDKLTRGKLIDAVTREGRVPRRRNAIYSRPPQGGLPLES